MDISEDPNFKTFLRKREIKPQTQELYTIILTEYCKFKNKTPTELLDNADKEEDQGIRLRNRSIGMDLLDYRDYIKEKNSPSTVKVRMTVVRYFFSDNGIELPKMKFKNTIKPEGITAIPSKLEIQKALNYANIKYRAIILLIVSSGLRSSDLLNLKYSDFLNSLKEYIKVPKNTYMPIDEVEDLLYKSTSINEVIPTWELVSQKRDNKFVTFSTPESLKALIRYLKEEPPKELDTPIFRSAKHKTQAISKRGFIGYFQLINKRCEFETEGILTKFRAHNLRKYFGTQLGISNVGSVTIERLLAHRVPALTDVYIKADPKSMKQEYIKAIENLSINEFLKPDYITTEDKKEFLELKNKYNIVSNRLESLEKQMKRKDRVEKYPDLEE